MNIVAKLPYLCGTRNLGWCTVFRWQPVMTLRRKLSGKCWRDYTLLHPAEMQRNLCVSVKSRKKKQRITTQSFAELTWNHPACPRCFSTFGNASPEKKRIFSFLSCSQALRLQLHLPLLFMGYSFSSLSSIDTSLHLLSCTSSLACDSFWLSTKSTIFNILWKPGGFASPAVSQW